MSLEVRRLDFYFEVKDLFDSRVRSHVPTTNKRIVVVTK